MSSAQEHRPLEPAIRLFHRRWSVPVVAMLSSKKGCRFVEMVNALGASRDTLSETLQDLTSHGLVQRNPGYGHPLRPEYILTDSGIGVGEAAVSVTTVVRRLNIVDVALKKWPMLVLVALGRGGDRFNAVQAMLPGISPRALTVALRNLQQARLIDRMVTDGHPPATAYTLTGAGDRAFPDLDAFCAACESIDPSL